MKCVEAVHSLDITNDNIYTINAYNRYKLHEYLWGKKTVSVEIIKCLPMKQGFKNRRWQVKVEGIKMIMLKHRNDERASFNFYRKNKNGEMEYWKSADHLYVHLTNTTNEKLEDPYEPYVVYIEICEEVSDINSHPITYRSESNDSV